MKGLKVYVIFMLVLVFAAGKEGVEAKTCTSTDLLEGCTDDFCNDQCIDSHVKEAKGVCVGAPGTTCQCTYPC
ncbi:hypothetical protein V6N11_000065 [Hibiscus sabdariffa]|uniref:Defensin-like protein n=1 Tax=Hibiscus sabdariffa TaxID=183260 RepID=A0ABR2NNP6_9ROSI